MDNVSDPREEKRVVTEETVTPAPVEEKTTETTTETTATAPAPTREGGEVV